MRNAIDFPSGDHSIAETLPFSSVIASASPPSTRIRQTFVRGSLPSLSLGPRAERNAIHFPSGDQAGLVEDLSPEVSAKAEVPSAFATFTCESHSLFSPSVTAALTTYATRVPSGDACKAVTRFTRSATSGVQSAEEETAARASSAAGVSQGFMRASFSIGALGAKVCPEAPGASTAMADSEEEETMARPRQPANVFERFAHKMTRWSGSTPTFLGALGVVAVWGALGPLFGYSDTW